MTVIQLVQQNRGLIQAFKRYRSRYLNKGKTADMTKLFPELPYSEMRLEGEKITRKQAGDLFK